MGREDYRIDGAKPIGRGSFGTVFEARRIADGQRVALKIVLHDGEWGPERIDAERKGAILQERFARGNGMVPEVYEFGADGEDFFIAMEFIEGTSLEGLLRRARLAPEDAAAHALWMCGFLEKAHAFCEVVDGKPYRIVHTDLKPAHLMVSPNGDRKVLDFGIAKALEESRELGTDIGRTTAYASPERLVSDQISPHADFWSLGVMLFEMVCGHRPYPQFDGPRYRRELEQAITSNAPRAPFPETCPPALGAIISKLLAFQVEHRYPHAAAIREDLERFLRGQLPGALSFYETPATTPVQRVAGGAVATLTPPPATVARVPTPSAPRMIPPTEPRPRRNEPTAQRSPTADLAQAAVAEIGPVQKKRFVMRRVLTALLMLSLVLAVATEGVAWMFAERFRDTIPSIDERTVTDRHLAYDAVSQWALFDFGLRARVKEPLLRALVAVGDRVISDYRREEPLMGPAEWSQANEALKWAVDMAPGNRSLRGQQLTAQGHVQRFAAQAARGSSATLLSQAAIATLRQAAQTDPDTFDPYLGMARIQVYQLADVDAAETSIAEAEKRGYTRGRREAALLGDGYMRRAMATRRRAGVLTGEQRIRELTSARADFQRCVELFDPIVAFGNAAENLEICKAQLERIDRQLMFHFQSEM